MASAGRRHICIQQFHEQKPDSKVAVQINNLRMSFSTHACYQVQVPTSCINGAEQAPGFLMQFEGQAQFNTDACMNAESNHAVMLA